MKYGSLRFCVDCRKLNAVTVRDFYPHIGMDEYIDSLGEARILPTLNVSSGYWQIKINERDRARTAFTGPHGLFRFLRIPFGSKIAPETFQRATNVVLSSARWLSAVACLDNIGVFLKNASMHMAHLRQVMILLRDVGLAFKLKKCAFLRSK